MVTVPIHRTKKEVRYYLPNRETLLRVEVKSPKALTERVSEATAGARPVSNPLKLMPVPFRWPGSNLELSWTMLLDSITTVPRLWGAEPKRFSLFAFSLKIPGLLFQRNLDSTQSQLSGEKLPLWESAGRSDSSFSNVKRYSSQLWLSRRVESFSIFIWECLLPLVAQGTFTRRLKSNPGTQKGWLIPLTGISMFSSRPQFPFPILYNKGKPPTGTHTPFLFHRACIKISTAL